MKNKKNVIAIVVAVLVVALFVGIYFATRPKTAQGSKSFTVEVVHGDGSTKTFTYRTDEEYLGKVLQDEGLIQGDEGQFGLYINTVDGETAVYETDGAYWALYEGQDYAAQGIDLTPVLDGSSFSLVYTIG